MAVKRGTRECKSREIAFFVVVNCERYEKRAIYTRTGKRGNTPATGVADQKRPTVSAHSAELAKKPCYSAREAGWAHLLSRTRCRTGDLRTSVGEESQMNSTTNQTDDLLGQRRRAAEEIAGHVRWHTRTAGQTECPLCHDCFVYLDDNPVPRFFCLHERCQAELAEWTMELQNRCGCGQKFKAKN